MAENLNFKHTNWGSRVNNPNGIKLQTLIANIPDTVSPTYFPTEN